MPDPLISLVTAKVKAMGLVAATALVTTALVGGGAVAVTVVSNETPQADVVAQQAAATGAESRSDTATAVIESKPDKPDKSGGPRERVDYPGCDSELNHGQNVSAFVRSLPEGPDRGAAVSDVARSDCGKPETAGTAGRPDSPGRSEGKAEGKAEGRSEGKAKGKDKPKD